MSSSAWRIAFSRSSVAISRSGSVKPGEVRLVGVVAVDLRRRSGVARPQHRRVPRGDHRRHRRPPRPAPQHRHLHGDTVRRPASRVRRCGPAAHHVLGSGSACGRPRERSPSRRRTAARFLADVVAAGLGYAAGQRLVEVLGRQHAEHHRLAGVEADAHDPGGGLAGDVLEVGGLAADDAAEADHGVVSRRPAPGRRGGSRTRRAPTSRSTSSSATPAAARPRRAPSSRRSVMWLLKRAATMAMRRPGAVEHRRGDLVAADVLGHQPDAPGRLRCRGRPARRSPARTPRARRSGPGCWSSAASA